VAGNVVGAGSGVVSGTAAGYSKAMDPSYHMVRYWRTETTPDGRTIQVPYDVMVDQYGRPMTMPAPTGNSKPIIFRCECSGPQGSTARSAGREI
jgi:hypothetical protein